LTTTGTHRAIRLTAVMAVAVALLCVLMPAAAAATPADLSSQISATQAQQQRAQQMVAQMHADLAAQMSAYTTLCTAILQNQAEVSQSSTDLARLDSQLATIQAQLDDRVALLYQSRGDHIVELFMASSLQDFLTRAEYLLRLGEADSVLVSDVAAKRAQSERMHAYLKAREADLAAQQLKADQDRARILAKLAANEAAAKAAGADLAGLLAQQKAQAAIGVVPGGGQKEPAGGFNQNTIISDTNFYDVNSMSAADVQAFLDTQKGPLKSYSALDHTGVMKTAAQMIWDAAQGWKVSPKVVLVTLQKEQSLLSETNPTQKDFDWALGAGWTDSKKILKYQGFGNQVWFGTSHIAKLANEPWQPGMTKVIDGVTVTPTNRPTWGLYRYTPHFGGNTSFWMIWWRHFGDPLK
jgi:peptidoglycan hydrolase CwlO-like protein